MKIEISDYEGVIDTGALSRFASAAFPPRAVRMLQVKIGDDVKALIDLDAFILPDYELPAPTVMVKKGEILSFETK